MQNLNVGTINGGNNQFNQNNKFNVNNRGGGNKNGGDPEGNGIALLAGAFAVMVVTAFVFLRYHDAIFFWLKLGIVVACVTHLMSFVAQWRDPDYIYRYTMLTVAGLALVLSQMWVLGLIQHAVSGGILDIFNQPTVATGLVNQAFEVWGRFNDKGHNIITESMTATLILAPAIGLNIAFSLHNFIESLARSEQNRYLAVLGKWLSICTSWGSPISAILTLVAYLMISGMFISHTF